MSSAIQDEILSINAIYGEDQHTLRQKSPNSDIFLLKIPPTEATLRLSFPPTYPDDAPTVLGPESSGLDVKKGAASEIASLASNALIECFTPGIPCVFDLIELVSTRLAEGSLEVDPGTSPVEQIDSDYREDSSGGEQVSDIEPPQWTISEVITEKKSVFVARAARVAHPDQARSYLRHLVDTDKKVAKATHNITAWRIKGPSDVTYQDYDDDGEDAAGGRILNLLRLMNVWNIVVVVSRWYGGVKLGPDRFRLINAAARDALTRGGFDTGIKQK